ncbi:serine/threonine-protein kinase HAL4/sat4 [Mortierella sp. AM989]|nr:serine/threonine-protein kinase HAL4/sat4 [Mortierella sp. AM989]
MSQHQMSADLQETRQTSSHCGSSNDTLVPQKPQQKSSTRHQGLPSMKIDTSFATIHQRPSKSPLLPSNDTQLYSPNHRHPKAWQAVPSLIMTPVTDQNENDGFKEHYASEDSDSHLCGEGAKVERRKSQCQHHVLNHQGLDLNADDVVHGLAISDSRQYFTPTDATIDDAALRPQMVRSTTAISTSSSGVRTRLTYRLSYLAHLEDLEAEETKIARDSAESKPISESHQERRRLPELVPAAADVLNNRLPRPFHQLSSGKSASQSMGEASVRTGAVFHSTLPPAHSQISIPITAFAPPIPNLYRRLLRIFKTPTDASDSDSGPIADVLPSSKNKQPRERGQFGLPANLNNSSRGSSKSLGFKQKSVECMVPVAALYNPSSSIATVPAPALGTNAAAQAHKLPESTGFRARFLKKLMSSPNLHAMVYPIAAPFSTSAQVHSGLAAHQKKQQQQQYCSQCHEDGLEEYTPLSPYSPLASDFEHEYSCPAGQRIQERRDSHPASATMPKAPSRMPTLQSKYGVPDRELGAGTQAHVMLLRVKSSKRLKTPQLYSSEANQSTLQQMPQRAMFAAEDGHPVDSLLSPCSRSGTLMTTTEDEVTPEQREAYRKRLLRRTSTAGLSIGEGGLIYAIKKFRPPKATETHRQYLKKVCAEFCISTSMDHENIIRTIDLVRDQPEQELFEDDAAEQQHEVEEYQGHMRSSQKYGRKSIHSPVGHRLPEDDCRDCSCPREHRRHVRAIKSADELYGSNQCSSSPTFPKHRSIHRRSAISKPQRKRSMDTLSNRRSIVEVHDQLGESKGQGIHQQSYQHHQHQHQHQHHHQHDRNSNQSEAQKIAAAKKKKQQQDQELRQKEVQRLKQQRQGEKQYAKQLQLDQFPEYCMVMEFAAGGDLFNLLTKSHPPIGLHEKHCLWRQLVNGVQYMHSMGVAHRDLKPENILIDATGRILKITDFGIANVFKSVGDPIPLPCRGIIGSAPEEFYQEEYDPRAVDVWACGIIFYVMFYSAMPWARADRKKDARFARYINDIMAHRNGEPQRRLQYERRQLRNNSTESGPQKSQGSLSYGSETFSRPHDVAYHRQIPSFQPTDYSCSTPSSGSGSPCSSRGHGDTESSNSSANCSPVIPSNVVSLDGMESDTPVVLPATYSTYSYNGYIGGHEFLDRIKNPGCRRILYAILEPDARKRVTIDQVVNDDWVSRIRYCTDCTIKQGQQAAAMHGQGASSSRYLQLPNGELHHQHYTPKKIKN